jgi:hypothetical protein
MRIVFIVAVLSGLGGAALAQNSLPIRLAVPSGFARIHKLTLVSSDLPLAKRQSIMHAFQGGTYDLDELGERIRGKLRDSGYALADVGTATVTRMRPDQTVCRMRPPQKVCDADVRYSVHTGDQFRLGGITFRSMNGRNVFTADQLRAQFPLQDGAIFNATDIGKGLENLKDLYGEHGYINFGAIPKPVYDNTLHTVSLIVDMDQGRSFKFGKLLFEGIEPRAGMAQSLLASWQDVEGKLYNPQLLHDWLKSTASDWPLGTLQVAQFQVHQDFEHGLVNPVLHFQCGTYPVLCP